MGDQAQSSSDVTRYDEVYMSGFSLNSDDFGAFLPVDHHELVAGCMARQTPR